MIEVGKMIARVRRDRKMSQQKLADKVGLSKQAISNYERGKREPDYITLEAIADALNAPVTMFISQEDKDRELGNIYATYDKGNSNTATILKEWKLLSGGSDELWMMTNALGKMKNQDPSEFMVYFNLLRTARPDLFKEGDDDDANDTES